MSEERSREYDGSEIAIVAMAGRFPGAPDLERFWDNLVRGVDAVRFLDAGELRRRGGDPALLDDPEHVAAVSEMAGADRFDAELFRVSHREAEILDPQQRVLLEVAFEALESAGYAPAAFDGPIAVFAGATTSTYAVYNLMADTGVRAGEDPLELLVANAGDTLTTRISYKLGLKGPSHAVQCACSSSLVAVHTACLSLLDGACDLALAGGVSVNVGLATGYRFRPGSLFSPDGRTRAFDARAAGTLFGSGAGMVVLRRLEDARAAGDPILAVIRGSAVNNDGDVRAGFTAPGVEGQAAVIAEALAASGVDPETVTYLEAHGSATPLGDPVEVQALTRAFRRFTGRTGFCAMGSVKTNVGHLDTAAGVAGLIKTVLALRHGLIPASLHFREPNPEIDFASSPVYVARELLPWEARGGPRRAGVSSFGLGGTNAHLVLEEAPPPPPPAPSRCWQMLAVSAARESSLDGLTSALAARLEERPELDLADAAFTLSAGRRPFAHRRFAVCRDAADAAACLAARDPRRVVTGVDPELPGQRPVAFLLPGLGDHYPGMARRLYAADEGFARFIDRGAALAEPLVGRDLRQVIWPPEEASPAAPAGSLRRMVRGAGEPPAAGGREPLQETALAQPAVFLLEMALAELWRRWGIRPAALAGYSLGEYTAACLAGVFSFEDGLRLVARRAALIADLPPGGMLAVSLGRREVEERLAGELDVAAENAPEMTVVAGPTAALAAFEERLAAEGASCRRLATTHPFHSRWMEPAAAGLAELLREVELAPPRCPLLSNLTGDWMTAAEATDPGYWVRQLVAPVRFATALAQLWRDPARVMLEVGPGRGLSTLALQHPASSGAPDPLVLPSLPAGYEAGEDLAFLLTTLGRLWLAGLPVSWPGFYQGQARRRVHLPTHPFEGRRYWIEPAAAGAPARSGEEKRPDPAGWLYFPSWKLAPPPAPRTPPVDPGPWWLVAGEGGLAGALAGRLRRAGAQVLVVRMSGPAAGEGEGGEGEEGRVQVDPRRRESWSALVEEAAAGDRLPRRVVHLAGADPLPERPAAGAGGLFAAAQERGLYALLALVRELARRSPAAPPAVTVVTRGLWAVAAGGAETAPERATLGGLVRVLPQEWPGARCRLVDLPPGGASPADGEPADGNAPDGEAAAERLLAELAAPGREPAVALRGEDRWLQTFEPLELAAGGEPLRPVRAGGVYLVTGGLSGVGAALAGELAGEGAAVPLRLVFVEPSPLPPRPEWQAWIDGHGPRDGVSRRLQRARRLEERGAEVVAVTARLDDEAEMRGVLAEVERRFGRLDGVLHSAEAAYGSEEGGEDGDLFPLFQETDEVVCRRHFRPKAEALEVLARVLEGRQPDFCLVCSSLASVLGGLGSSAYAAASLFADAFVQRRWRRGDRRWIAVNWDVWRLPDEPGSLATLSPDLARLALSPEEGGQVLRRILASCTAPQVVVSTADLGRRLERWLAPGAPPEAASSGRTYHARPGLKTPYEPPRGETEEGVAAIWRDLLGVDRVGRHDSFFELGGHSLLSTRMVSRLRDAFGVELSLRGLFEVPTVAAVAENVELLRWAAAGAERAAAASGEREVDRL